MGKKRYNNIYKKYTDNIQDFDMDYAYYNNSFTKEDFTKSAYKKIDIFIKYLYNSMNSHFKKSNNQVALLCRLIQGVLKNNLYNNHACVYDLFYHIFQIPNTNHADYGLYPSFSYSYNKNFLEFGNNLVIQIIFYSPQGDDRDNMPVYQIRCNYIHSEGQINGEFDQYFKSENFLTTEDYLKYYNLHEKDSGECEDCIGVTVVKLSYCELLGGLYDKNTLEDNIINFYNDMSNVEW